MHHSKQKQTTLGIAGVLVAVLTVTHAPPTLAQTEFYITAADEAAACEGVCNTYVPPQDEQECRDLAGERLAAEYERNIRRSSRIQSIYDEAMEVSGDIFQDELSALIFASCVLAANALPSPADFTAVSKCIGWHALKMAGIIANHNRAMDRISADYKKSYDIISLEADLREERIKDRKEVSLSRENVRNQFQTDLIATDLELCLARVNDN